MLNDEKIKEKLLEKGIDDINIFKLPIKNDTDNTEQSIRFSLNKMIEKVGKKHIYIKKLDEWLQTTK